MRRLTIWLAIATLTFIFGQIATMGWYVYRSHETSILEEFPAEGEPLSEVPKTPIPLCELVEKPTIYENHPIRVSAILFGDTGIITIDPKTRCPVANNVVRIEYESTRVRAESEQLINTIDNKMDHCWRGIGVMDGKLEASTEGHGHRNEFIYRFIVTHLENPQFVSSCAQF